MKERIKITSEGSLNKGDKLPMLVVDGDVQINGDFQVGEEFKVTNKVEKSVVYDSTTEQYSVDGQWQIPFHKYDEKNNSNLRNESIDELKNIYYGVKSIKNFFVNEQEFEISTELRNIEKSIYTLVEKIK